MIEQLADLQYRALDRLRSSAAVDAARREGTEPDFEALRGARQCLVVSFKRSGEPVPTPVNFGLSEDGRLYFRSEPRSAKVMRIRRNPRVRVVPCSFRGKPTGPLAEGTARILPASESESAEAIVAGNWTPGMKALDRLPLEIVYVEVMPGATPADAEIAAPNLEASA